MRRPRHKLQVSTFPFLAVLLGAMGALILLLLVMDRRSKIVARNRAIEAHAAQVAARAKEGDHHLQDEEARRAEWERQRRALHDLLRRQEADLTQERRSLDTKLKALNQDLQEEKKALTDLEKSLLEKRARLDVKSQLLTQLREGIARSGKLDAASQSEVEKLARDLAELERALQEAKTLKTHEQETYSLVPYRGKLGEGRRPVYVECAAAGLIFHPEGRRLSNAEFDIRIFRNEVERRGVELVREKHDPDRPHRPPQAKVKANPYVLFLVRQDGLESYYNATTALRGFDLDFGYEFIATQWALDFSHGAGIGGQIAAHPDGPLRPTRPLGAPKGGNPPKAAGLGNGPNLGNGTGPPSAAAATDTDSGPPQGAIPSGPGLATTKGIPGDSRQGPGYAASLYGPGSGPQLGPGRPGTGQLYAGLANNQPGTAATGQGDSSPGQGAAGQQGSGSNLGPGGAGSVGMNNPSGESTPGIPGNAAGSQGSQNTSAQGRAAQRQRVQGQPTQDQQAQGEGDTQDLAWRGSAPPTSQKSPGGVEMAKATGDAASRQGSDNVANSANAPGGDPGSMDPLARLAPNIPFADTRPGPKKPAPAPTVGRLLANRDYILTIECFSDVVALYPSSQVFAMANRAEQRNIDGTLVQAVLQLIARRQATVRAGEAPYRPMLRFQVHPEALRTYFHVYPLFENLRIPMTRENLDS